MYTLMNHGFILGSTQYSYVNIFFFIQPGLTQKCRERERERERERKCRREREREIQRVREMQEETETK